MEFKGTKGNWSYETTKKGHCRVSGNDWSNFCKVYTITSCAVDWKKTTQANAQLISCAPEMLEMLVKIHKTTKDEDIKSQVELLIKKATEI
jgi:hypothetical protein